MLLNVVFLHILLISCIAQGSIVQVRAGAKFCLVSTLTPGDANASKFGARLAVFNDDTISITMSDPTGNTIYSAQNKKEDSFSFNAHAPGEFKICLDNSTGTTQRSVSVKVIGGRDNDLTGNAILL
jgi:hypothetical protein